MPKPVVVPLPRAGRGRHGPDHRPFVHAAQLLKDDGARLAGRELARESAEGPCRQLDAGDVGEAAPDQDLVFHGQAAPLVVGEARPSGTMHRAEDPILLEQVTSNQ
jgi:hypothetical protein